MIHPPRISLAICLCALWTQLTAEVDSIGSIEAVIDGQARTWHIVTIEGDEAAAGAMWMILSPEEGEVAMAALGGFESKDVVFGRDPETDLPTVSGEGSQLVISFEFPLGAASAELSLPSQGGGDASVLLMPVVGDYAVMHGIDEGTISVSVIEANKNGSSRFEGTFSGRLVDRDGEVLGQITGGRFKVHDAIFFSPE